MRIALALLTALPLAADIPFYVDATVPAGIDHVYGGHEDFVVGGGVAAFDCDANGLPDLAAAGGEAPFRVWRNVTGPGAIRFEEARAPRVSRSTGVWPLDWDGDGVPDLFVTAFGQNRLLLGLGECRFRDATRQALPAAEDWSTAFAATWEDGAPTVFVGNYVPRDRPLQRRGNCEPSYLLRAGDRIELAPAACTLSALFVDWAGDGRADLRLANDREYYDPGLSEQLWRLTPDGAEPYTAEDGWDDVSLWGMGIGIGEVTGDARPELAVTSMADNRLETARGAGAAFDDIARARNATAQRPHVGRDLRPSTAWHAEFGDVNNDGLVDLWIVKGNVSEMPQMAAYDPDSLLLNRGDRFEEVGFAAGIALPGRGRGGAMVDLNGDGALDLVTVLADGPMRVFQARGPLGTWLAVDPRQDGPNGYAVGARVEVETSAGPQRRWRLVGGGHAGGQLLPIHIGLGTAAEARVRIVWPDGAVGAWHTLPAGQVHRIDR